MEHNTKVETVIIGVPSTPIVNPWKLLFNSSTPYIAKPELAPTTCLVSPIPARRLRRIKAGKTNKNKHYK